MGKVDIVTILIAAAVAAVIVVVFRKFDRDNNSMEKVKRYADKRLEGFDDYFKKQDANIASAGAELETKYLQAAAGIKRLQKERDDFLAGADELQKYKQAIAAAEAKINGYDKSLASLAEMTMNVEENLTRLKKEALIVEKLDARIDAQKKTIDEIEKSIPHIAGEFSQKNGEQLKLLGAKLLQEYDARSKELAEHIASLGKQADDALVRFQSEIEGVYDSAAKKADSLEDTAFRHLSEQAQARSDAYVQTIEDKIAEIESLVDERIAEAESRVHARADEAIEAAAGAEADVDEKYQERYRALSDKYEGEMTALAARLDSGIARAMQEIEGKILSIDGAIGSRTAEMIKKYDAQYTQFTDVYKKRLEDYGAKLDRQYAELSEKHMQKANETDASVTAQYGALSEKYKELAAKTNAALASQYGALSETYKKKAAEIDGALTQKTAEAVAAFKDSTGNIVANIKKQLTSLDEKYKQHIDEFGKRYDEKIDSLQGKYTKQLESIDGKNDGRIASLDAKFDALFSKLSSAYEEKASSLEKQAESIAAMYDEKEGAVAADLNERIVSLGSEYGGRIEKLSSDLAASLSEVKATSDFISQNVSGNAKSLEGLRAMLESEVKNIESRYNNLFANAVSAADEKEKAAFEKFSAASGERLEKYQAQVQHKIDAFKTSLSETLVEISRRTDDSVNDAESAIKELRAACDEAQRRADSAGPQLAEKIQLVDEQIEKFRAQSETKLADLDKALTESIYKIAKQCEQQQSDALNAIDSQFGSYKKDLAYQFSRLETSGKDIDSLEANLRKAMDEIRKRVLSDFDLFTETQQKKHKEFSDSLQADSDAIQSQLHTIEETVDALKQSAIGNVKAKLKDFEDGIDDDLKTRAEKIAEDLTVWKNSFDGKLALFTEDCENGRRSLEIKYSEDLKAKLDALQEKNDEQLSRIASGVKEANGTLREQIDGIAKTVDDFAETTKERVNKTQAISDEYLKTVAGQYEAKMNDELERVKSELSDGLKKFEEAVLNRQETGASTIDAALSEFNTWKQHLKQQLDESNAVFKGQLDTLKSSSQNKIDEARESLLADFQTYSADMKEKQASLSASVNELQTKTDESLDMYESRSEEILERLQAMYEEMLKDTEERVSKQSADSAKTLSDLRGKINSLEAQSSENQAKFVLKMQSDQDEMQSRMGELNRELQNVRSQMLQYEKAEAMKKALDERIAALDDDFARLASYNETALSLADSYKALHKMYDDINGRLKEFDAQKARVDSIGQKYDKMINLSSAMDEKISGLQTSYDELQTFEVAVRDFQEKLHSLSGSYDRLEQKQTVIERVNEDVNRSFDALKTLEDKLKQCVRQTESLPQEIKDVQKDVDKLLKSGPKLAQAVTKLESLDAILTEADKRMDALTSARQGIGRSEARLEELKTDIESKFKLLNQLTKKDLEKHPAKEDKRLSPQDRDNIKQLKQQGWTVKEIARTMKRTQTEIEMVLELPE